MQCPGRRGQEGALCSQVTRRCSLTPHSECNSWTLWGPQDHVLSCSHISTPAPAVDPHLSSSLPIGFQPASHPVQPSCPGPSKGQGACPHVPMLRDATAAFTQTELVDEFRHLLEVPHSQHYMGRGCHPKQSPWLLWAHPWKGELLRVEEVLMTNILADENSVNVVNEVFRGVLEIMGLNEIGERLHCCKTSCI